MNKKMSYAAIAVVLGVLSFTPSNAAFLDFFKKIIAKGSEKTEGMSIKNSLKGKIKFSGKEKNFSKKLLKKSNSTQNMSDELVAKIKSIGHQDTMPSGLRPMNYKVPKFRSRLKGGLVKFKNGVRNTSPLWTFAGGAGITGLVSSKASNGTETGNMTCSGGPSTYGSFKTECDTTSGRYYYTNTDGDSYYLPSESIAPAA